MTLELLLKHLGDAVKRHLDYLDIDNIEGGTILPREVNDDEVVYQLIIKRGKDKPIAGVEQQPSSTSKTCPRCPRCKSTSAGCEFFDEGTCRGVVYPTYPPQYDPCVFSQTTNCR